MENLEDDISISIGEPLPEIVPPRKLSRLKKAADVSDKKEFSIPNELEDSVEADENQEVDENENNNVDTAAEDEEEEEDEEDEDEEEYRDEEDELEEYILERREKKASKLAQIGNADDGPSDSEAEDLHQDKNNQDNILSNSEEDSDWVGGDKDFVNGEEMRSGGVAPGDEDGDIGAATQRVLRDVATRDRIGKGAPAELKPLSGILEKLKQRNEQIRESAKARALPDQLDFDDIMSEAMKKSNKKATAVQADGDRDGDNNNNNNDDDDSHNESQDNNNNKNKNNADDSEESLVLDSDNEGLEDVCLVDLPTATKKKGAYDSMWDFSQAPDIEDEAPLIDDGYYSSSTSEDDDGDEKEEEGGGDTGRRKRLSPSGDIKVDEGAASEGSLDSLMEETDNEEDGSSSGEEGDGEEDGGDDKTATQEEDDDGDGANNNNNNYYYNEEGAPTFLPRPAKPLNKATKDKLKSMFVEQEAELSEEDEDKVSDDEDEDAMDAAAAEFQDFITDKSQKQIGKQDKEALERAHQDWQRFQDTKELQAVLRGVRQGFRRGRDDLSDDEDDAAGRRRRVRVAGEDGDDDGTGDIYKGANDYLAGLAGMRNGNGGDDDEEEEDEEMMRRATHNRLLLAGSNPGAGRGGGRGGFDDEYYDAPPLDADSHQVLELLKSSASDSQLLGGGGGSFNINVQQQQEDGDGGNGGQQQQQTRFWAQALGLPGSGGGGGSDPGNLNLPPAAGTGGAGGPGQQHLQKAAAGPVRRGGNSLSRGPSFVGRAPPMQRMHSGNATMTMGGGSGRSFVFGSRDQSNSGIPDTNKDNNNGVGENNHTNNNMGSAGGGGGGEDNNNNDNGPVSFANLKQQLTMTTGAAGGKKTANKRGGGGGGGGGLVSRLSGKSLKKAGGKSVGDEGGFDAAKAVCEQVVMMQNKN